MITYFHPEVARVMHKKVWCLGRVACNALRFTHTNVGAGWNYIYLYQTCGMMPKTPSSPLLLFSQRALPCRLTSSTCTACPIEFCLPASGWNKTERSLSTTRSCWVQLNASSTKFWTGYPLLVREVRGNDGYYHYWHTICTQLSASTCESLTIFS